MPYEITTKIAGIFKYPEAKEPMKEMRNSLVFEREPSNPYDANAIALYITSFTRTNGGNEEKLIRQKCGYIPKEHAAQLRDRKIVAVRRGVAFDQIIVTVE